QSVSAIDDTNTSQKTVPKNVITDVAKAIDKLKSAPSISTKADQLTAQLLALMQDQYDLLQDIDRGGTITLMQARRAADNTRKFRDFSESFSSWVDAEGERYGIVLRKPR